MTTPKAPPFRLTPVALGLTGKIMQLIGRFEGLQSPQPQLKLRRGSRVHTVLGSLAIEGNTLTLDQATAIFDGKRVAGPRRHVLELQNAIRSYDAAGTFTAWREQDLRKAHRMMMEGLVPDAGKYRSGGVGVFQGSRVAHVAPPAKRVPALVQDLLHWIKAERTLDDLIVSSVAHYELEFIHPFSDGNGRMGRLWQHVLLLRRHPVFEWIPVESVIHRKQSEYYRVLGQCDQAGDATLFVEFALATILEGVEAFVADVRPEPLNAERRLENARTVFEKRWFSRKEYMAHFKTLSSATASRDLRHGVSSRLLQRQGDKAVAQYRFR